MKILESTKNKGQNKKRLLQIILCSLIFILTAFGYWRRAEAQGGEDGWKIPGTIPGSANGAYYPTLIADPTGAVHAFWVILGDQWNEPNSTLMWYARWDGNSWSEPVDIIISPNTAPMRLPEVALDSKGNLHLVWGNSEEIYYSWAPACMAFRATAWSDPLLLARTAFKADIVVDTDDNVHIVYSDKSVGARGIYHIRSQDQGWSWSTPTEISRIPNFPEVWPGNVRLAIDDRDRLHVIWTQLDTQGFPGISVNYARSTDNDVTWSSPVELDTKDPDYYTTDWGNIVTFGEDQVLLVWYSGHRPFRYYRVSHDGGETWTTPVRVLPDKAGETGFSEMVVDSLGQVHMISAMYTTKADGTGSIQPWGIFHTIWNGSKWLPPEFVVAGTMEWPEVAIVRGNQLVVVFPDDDGLLYATKRTMSPSIPAVDCATFVSLPIPTVDSSYVRIPEKIAPTSVFIDTLDISNSPSSSPWKPLLAGATSVLLIVSVVLVSRRWGHHRS